MADKKAPNAAQRLLFWKREKKPTTSEAVTRLQNLQETMEKKSEYLDKKVEAETKVAMEHRTKNKRLAMKAMRRRKQYLKQQEELDGQMMNVEEQLMALQGSAFTTEMYRCMQASSQAMQEQHKNMSVDELANLRDDIDDMMQDTAEFGGILSKPIGEELDEDEFEAALNELALDEFTNEITCVDELPEVPSTSVPEVAAGKAKTKKTREEEDDEEELKKLAEWM